MSKNTFAAGLVLAAASLASAVPQQPAAHALAGTRQYVEHPNQAQRSHPRAIALAQP